MKESIRLFISLRILVILAFQVGEASSYFPSSSLSSSSRLSVRLLGQQTRTMHLPMAATNYHDDDSHDKEDETNDNDCDDDHLVSSILRQQQRRQHQQHPVSSSSSSWTLEEDWKLVDTLPKFTVGTGDDIRTFWAQLSAATPRLSSKKISDLYQRCHELSTNYTIQYGPSPPLLQNWDMDLSSSSSSRDNRAVGTLEDGRVIFLKYHIVGRLAGDTFQDVTSPSVMALIPGGYLEAVGGRIYELGEPRRKSHPTTTFLTRSANRNSFPLFPSNSFTMWQEEDDDDNDNVVRPTITQDSSADKDNLAWWLPGVTGTMSAMLASTILSACIGYGAGLGIIADETGHSHDGTTGDRHPIMRTTSYPTDIQMVHYRYASSSSSSHDYPSLEERKARAEYRALREQRVIQKLTEQLDKDIAELRAMERIQFMEQQHQQQEDLLP